MHYIKDELTKTQDVMQVYGVNPLLAKVIESRQMDLREFKAMQDTRFLYHDFELFSEGEMALERIHEAMDNHEKIAVYGDYDCDGILATTILVQAFHELGVEVGYHIPDRHTDGYGLNMHRVEQMAARGYTLIITVDNGIKAHEAVERANELGVDVIITDHHAFDPEEELPDAVAIVHTGLSADYPFKDICGGFVAYKLAMALLGHHDGYLYTLAAITTVSDMMPLKDENRCVVQRGIKAMEMQKYEPVELLKSPNQSYDATLIGFTLAPRINAAGRLPEMMPPNNWVRYFLKDTPSDVRRQIAAKAVEINDTRKQMTATAVEMVEAPEKDLPYVYFAHDDVHEGIIGLIAGACAREYEAPSFVMKHFPDTHLYKGSARGAGDFDVNAFFNGHKDLFVQCGGHRSAGGFTVDEDHYEALEKALADAVKGRTFPDEQMAIPVTGADVSVDNVQSLHVLEPFGMGNDEPVFLIEHARIANVMPLSNGKHVKVTLDLGNQSVDALWFSHGDKADVLAQKSYADVYGTLKINTFRGRTSVNVMVRDIL